MTYIKICGLTNLTDALAAHEAGADYLGFICFSESQRAITAEGIQQITEQLPADVQSVGVFVNEPLHTIYDVRKRSRLKLVQLHGKESPLTVRAVGRAYKAIRPATVEELQTLMKVYGSDWTINVHPDGVPDLLIDTYHPTLHGGTGQQVNHDLALAAQKYGRRLMLAGGLQPDNVAEIVKAIRPWAVDVSSGIEATPGKKDHGKLKAFIQAVREADHALQLTLILISVFIGMNCIL